VKKRRTEGPKESAVSGRRTIGPYDPREVRGPPTPKKKEKGEAPRWPKGPLGH
jgi:hypothetical protein